MTEARNPLWPIELEIQCSYHRFQSLDEHQEEINDSVSHRAKNDRVTSWSACK